MITVKQTANLGDIMTEGKVKNADILRLGAGVLVMHEVTHLGQYPLFDYYIDLKHLEGTRYEIVVRMCENEQDESEADQLMELLKSTEISTDSLHFEARRAR